jgi:hypothetical protein
MTTRSVPAPQWESFLAGFGRAHRAWLTTVETAAQDRVPRVDARWRPLDAVVTIQDRGQLTAIEVYFQDDEMPTMIHVSNPRALRVEETPEGGERGIEIDDQDGVCTRIRFRTSPLPEALDGLTPGELEGDVRTVRRPRC